MTNAERLGMNTYKIEVHSQGYEDYTLMVKAPTLRDAKRREREAKVAWCDLNDIDLDSTFDLPFTRVTPVQHQ